MYHRITSYIVQIGSVGVADQYLVNMLFVQLDTTPEKSATVWLHGMNETCIMKI